MSLTQISFQNNAYSDDQETCPLDLSFWAYLPSLAANGLFLALFSISFVVFFGQSILSKRFLGFTIAMLSGCALEIIGYVGRILSWYNPFSNVSGTAEKEP